MTWTERAVALPDATVQRGLGWPAALAMLAIVIFTTVITLGDTAAAMVGIWARSDTFAHAFLVPPISAWMIWRRRARLARMSPEPFPPALFAMAAVAFGWLLGDLASVNAVTQLALVALMVLSVPTVLGLRVTSEIAFPLVFLFFSVPVGEFLTGVLMEGTADFTVAALRISGIPVYREGLQFVIPSGQWSVVEACSGIRYLIASFMVGTLFAYLNYRSNKKRIIFGLVSLIVPIIANWLRAYMIVMIGHLSNNELATGVDHLVYGWVFFGVVITVMFLIGSRWADPDQAVSLPATVAGPSAHMPTLTALVTLGAVAVLLLPQFAERLLDRQTVGASKPVVVLPELVASGAIADSVPNVEWKPRFLGASTHASRTYEFGSRAVGVQIFYYRAQTYENKLVNSQNVVVASNDRVWNRIRSGVRTVSVPGEAISVVESELLRNVVSGQSAGPRLRVWQVYWVNGAFTSSDSWAKFQGALSRLTGHGDDGAAVFLYSFDDRDAEGVSVLDAFAKESLPLLAEVLKRTSESR